MPDKKRNMSPRDRAIYEQYRRKKAAEKRRKRAAFYKYAGRVGIMALVASLLFFIILAITMSIDFSSAPEKYEYSLKINVDGEEVKPEKSISVKNNICYVSLGAMSKIFGFSISGDVHTMNAVFENGDKISFLVDSDIYTVNGVTRSGGGASYFSGSDGDVYVPITFFNGTFDGIVLKREENRRKVKYTLEIKEGFGVAFEKSSPIGLPDMSKVITEVKPENEFLTDLSEYEKYMNPENPDEYIKLINVDYPLGADYVPADLVNISYTRRDGRATQQMREAAAKSLDAMFIEMYANGFTDVTVTSAYRNYNYQKQLFDNKLSYYKKYYDYDTAYAKTAKENAIPGTSEHQSGLCADLHNLPSASQAFESKEAYDWLVTHCADFGFILRYPKDKQDITKIIYEPWHYRFVGRYHAQKIMRSGLCLEEYCAENGIGLQ